MSRLQRILQAIADALHATRQDVVIMIVLTLGAVILLVAGAAVMRWMRTRRINAALRSRFEKEIRRLDLTIGQLDAVEEMAQHLNDRNKKYLLLTNKNTFLHCRRAIRRPSPALTATLQTLEARLGFSGTEGIALALGDFLPTAGVVVKVEVPGSRGRIMASVVSSQERSLTLRPEPDARLPRGGTVLVWASHPSGLVVAPAVVEVAGPPEAVIRLERPFAEPDSRRLAGNALKVFVRREAGHDEPQPTNVRELWSHGATLDNPDRAYRRRDDIQIVLRRNHAAWVVVNAEVVGLMKQRRVMRVRFSHLSDEARREILGGAA